MSKTIKTPDSSCIAETEYISTGKRVGNVRIRFNSGSEFVYLRRGSLALRPDAPLERR